VNGDGLSINPRFEEQKNRTMTLEEYKESRRMLNKPKQGAA